MEWVARLTAVALVMVLPGLAGKWLDDRWGTSFLALSGLVFGFAAGLWYLLVMTSQSGGSAAPTKKTRPRAPERPTPDDAAGGQKDDGR